MLARQMCAPNSPQWFNTGLHWAYGIDGPSQGHHYVDYRSGKLTKAAGAYEHPQPHACFIQSVSDDLVNDGGIMDLWTREARLFKYGSGTGSNFSKLRGAEEPLAGGGRSSGLMSFLRIGDRAAGAIKSGGTTRRAAKMVTVDLDHPDILDYIDWKVTEEQKVAALVAGSKLCNTHLNAVMQACQLGSGADRFDPKVNTPLKQAIRAARKAMIPENYVRRVIQFAQQGYEKIEFRTYDTDWDSEAYLTVSGQNSNNSVRVPNAFIEAGGARRRLGSDPAHRRRSGRAAGRPRTLEPHCRSGLGLRRSRRAVRHHDQRLAHLPRRRAHQCLQPLLRVHVPRRHGLQSGVAEPHDLPAGGRQLRRRSLPPCRHDLDGCAGSLRPDGAVPEPGDRGALLQVPHAGTRLRQPRRTADVPRSVLRQRGRPRPGRRHHGADDRPVLRHLGRDGPGAGGLPRLRGKPRRDAAGDPQPSPGRPWPQRGLRSPLGHAGSARPCELPRPAGGCGRRDGLGRGRGAGLGARLPQRAGDRHRPDRHDRSGDGLRHHRHRAGLRAGQVQEAGRRRLLQDHQPHGPRGSEAARLQPCRGAGDRALCGRPRHAGRRPGRQPRNAEGERLHRGGPERSGIRPSAAPSTSSSPSTSGRSARASAVRRWASATPSWTTSASICWPPSASPRRRSRPPTSTAAAP